MYKDTVCIKEAQRVIDPQKADLFNFREFIQFTK